MRRHTLKAASLSAERSLLGALLPTLLDCTKPSTSLCLPRKQAKFNQTENGSLNHLCIQHTSLEHLLGRDMKLDTRETEINKTVGPPVANKLSRNISKTIPSSHILCLILRSTSVQLRSLCLPPSVCLYTIFAILNYLQFWK